MNTLHKTLQVYYIMCQKHGLDPREEFRKLQNYFFHRLSPDCFIPEYKYDTK